MDTHYLFYLKSKEEELRKDFRGYLRKPLLAKYRLDLDSGNIDIHEYVSKLRSLYE